MTKRGVFVQSFLVVGAIGMIVLHAPLILGAWWRYYEAINPPEVYHDPISLYNHALSLAQTGNIQEADRVLGVYLSQIDVSLPRARPFELQWDIIFVQWTNTGAVLDWYKKSYAIEPIERLAQKIAFLESTLQKNSSTWATDSGSSLPEEGEDDRASTLSGILSDQQKRQEYLNITSNPSTERADRERLRNMINAEIPLQDQDW